MGNGQGLYTQAELETQKSIARVETLISIGRDDFNDHKKEDDANFKRIFEAVEKIPNNIRSCKQDLQNEVLNTVENNYVTKLDYKVFITKLTWGVVGATAAASVISWLLQLATASIKIFS